MTLAIPEYVRNPMARSWINEAYSLCKPDQIHWCDGSEEEYDALAYQRVLNFAKSLKAEITLFHVIPHRIEPVLQSGNYLLGGGWVSTPDYVTEEEEQQRKLADQWVNAGRKIGITVKTYFNTTSGSIPDLIIRYAKTQNFSWIAMVAESGAISSALIGSISRQVVRHSSCPVWVLGTHGTSAKETNVERTQTL